jgi:hypothetical protein
MRIPRRFALSTLLLLMLVVASIFGYAQWRRQWILQKEKELEAQGARILVGDDWFWPVLSSYAVVRVDMKPDGIFLVGEEQLNEDMAKLRVQRIFTDMRKMGIQSGHVDIFSTLPDGKEARSRTVGYGWME